MMMMEKEDLGLSLSLSSVGQGQLHQFLPLQLNRMPSSLSFPFLPSSQWGAHPLPHPRSEEKRPVSETCGGQEPLPAIRGIDVNRAPAAGAGEGESEEEAGASSPNSTLSSVSGKRADRDGGYLVGDDADHDRACSNGISDEEDGGEGSRKKLRLSKDQSAVLEESFKEHNTLNPKQKLALAKQLNLRPRQVEVWFQNRRARTKLKQTEVDCEFLRRCCETLTEENRRLQKEVQELRALKLSPHFYMHMTPPTTLTMCPSCERVSNSNATAAAPHILSGAGGAPSSPPPADPRAVGRRPAPPLARCPPAHVVHDCHKRHF